MFRRNLKLKELRREANKIALKMVPGKSSSRYPHENLHNEQYHNHAHLLAVMQEDKLPAAAFNSSQSTDSFTFSRFDLYQEILPLTIANEIYLKTNVSYLYNQGFDYHSYLYNQGFDYHRVILSALKLSMAFTSYDAVIAYLERYEASNDYSVSQLIHNACLYSFPENDNWNVTFWQRFIEQQQPANAEHASFSLLNIADKVEQGLQDNREQLVAEITATLTKQYRQRFQNEYVERKSKQPTPEAFVAEKLAKQQKTIKSRAQKKLNADCLKALQLQDKKQLTADDIEALRQAKANHKDKLTEYEDVIRTELQEKLIQQYNNAYSSVAVSEEDYIKNKLRKHANEIKRTAEARLKLTDNISIDLLLRAAENSLYENAKKNPAAAILFIKHGVPESDFNEYLTLTPIDNDTHIPSVKVDANIGPDNKRYVFKKLDPADPRAAVLGRLTSCCQSIHQEGARPAKHGITSPYGGFYVLCDAESDDIVAQCWAWRASNNTLVFDSIESNIDFRRKTSNSMIADAFMQLAENLVDEHHVPRVVAGTDGETPDELEEKLFIANTNVFPHDYSSYRDSRENQVILADKNLPLKSCYRQGEHEGDPASMSKAAIFEWVDLCILNDEVNSKLHYIQRYLDDTGLTQKEIDQHIAFTKQYMALIEKTVRTNTFTDDDFQEVIELIQRGVNPNIFIELELPGKIIRSETETFHGTLLHAIAPMATCEQLKVFANLGVDPNLQNSNEETMLLIAAKNKNWSLVRKLITSYHVNINAFDRRGNSALTHAVSQAEDDTKHPKWLIKHGVKYCPRDLGVYLGSSDYSDCEGLPMFEYLRKQQRKLEKAEEKAARPHPTGFFSRVHARLHRGQQQEQAIPAKTNVA